MSSDISYKDSSLWVSNRRLSTLIDFALAVGADAADSPEEAACVRRLRGEEDAGVLFPGCSFDLNERFPTVAAKKFWAGVFFEVARRIFLRSLGNQEDTSWQPSAICDAQLVGRMLERAVREVEPQWVASEKSDGN